MNWAEACKSPTFRKLMKDSLEAAPEEAQAVLEAAKDCPEMQRLILELMPLENHNS